MSGETEQNVSGWTVDTLKSHFDTLRVSDTASITRRFDAAEISVQHALDAADKASTKSDNAIEKRFDGVNEFRGAMNDLAARLMPRAEVEALIKSLNEKIDDTRGTRRQGGQELWGYAVGALGLGALLFDAILHATGH